MLTLPLNSNYCLQKGHNCVKYICLSVVCIQFVEINNRVTFQRSQGRFEIDLSS